MNEEKICCPQFNPAPWNNQEVVFDNKMFIKEKTVSFLYMPLNMGSMMQKTCDKIEKAGATSEMKDWIMLSRDISPWKCEHYIAVKKEVPNLENVRMTGTFLTRVFEGPYKEAKKWYNEMKTLAKEKGIGIDKIYFYYTTCPKCAKKWGKNYVVGLLKTK